MAKKDKQAKKDKSGGTAADAVDAIRSAIERGLEGAGLTEKRQREVVDQVSAAAGRIRQTLDDLKVVDEVQDMRRQLETLAARVAELEAGARSRVTGAARAASSRGTNSGAAGTAAAKPASARATKSSGTTKSSGNTKASGTTKASSARATKSTGTTKAGTAKASTARTTKAASTRAKPAAKSSTAKPRTTRARPKPAGGGGSGSSGGSSS